jgi:Protein of unknown function (DUF3667)
MDEQSHIVAAEAAVTSVLEPPRRRLFSRRRKISPPRLPFCENCGAKMSGSFCAQCGQHAVDYRRSFGRVLADVLDSLIGFESKFFATLWLLMSRPWKLTIAFLSGKRVRYMHPLRLYLLISIVFFFGVHELAKQANFDSGHRKALTPEQKAQLETKLAKLPAGIPPEARAEVKKAIEDAAKPQPSPEANGKDKDEPFLEVGTDKDDINAPPFEKWLNHRLKEKIGEHGVNFKVFFMAVTGNLPVMMLCCIPLFALVLKILYLFRRVFYIDHLIYALHIHAFAYLAILLIGFISAGLIHVAPAVSGWIMAALIVTAVMLLLLSIRRVYRQGWFMSIFKFLFGGVIYLIVLCLALGATFVVTIALPD